MNAEQKTIILNGLVIIASILIVLSGAIIPQTAIDIFVQFAGLLLILWAAITIKMHKPKHALPKGYFFLDKGPYEIIRHPIYAGYLLIMISFVEIEFTFLRFITFILLYGVIQLKIINEENIIKRKLQQYADYMQKTKALIPYLL